MGVLAPGIEVGKPGFDFLADKDFVHQIFPTCGAGQLTQQPGGCLLNGALACFRCGHMGKKPQYLDKCKQLFRFSRFRTGGQWINLERSIETTDFTECTD